MHFAKIPDEPAESSCYIKTNTTEVHGKESISEASSENNSSGDSEDERVQRLAKLQEQVVDCIGKSFCSFVSSCCRSIIKCFQ